MSYLVDTDVLSEATRPRPEAKVLAWLERHDAELHISTLTLGEIVKGTHLLAHGQRRRQLETWCEDLIASFAGRILPVDELVARTWGEFYAKHQRVGQTLPSLDSLLAATAIAHKLTLATHNIAD